MRITDTAVQAALDSWFSPELENHKELHFDDMKELIAAVIPHLKQIDVAAVRKQAFEEGIKECAEIADAHNAFSTYDAILALSAEPSKLQTCEKTQTEHSRISQLENALSSILFEDSDKSEQQRMIDRVKARAVLEDTEPAQGEQWLPIETAPINQSILVHYDDGKIELINADYNDYAWVAYTGKQDFCTKPTHWMPLPAAPTSEADRAALAQGGVD